MHSLGINIGSSSLKIVHMNDDKILWNKVLPHEGDFIKVLKETLLLNPPPENIQSLVTGTDGRFLFNINNTIETLCIEEALKQSNIKVDAVVCMGGEDLIVYTIDNNFKIINNFSGSKCASGTGEFFKQQLYRMNMKLDDVNTVSDSNRVLPLSARCSVFMKSDCTHKLNKREATKDDIVLSLSNIMAIKVIEFLKKAKIAKGKVLLTGGITLNRHIIRFIKQKAPEIEFIIPSSAPFFEAEGAAYLAKETGSALPPLNKLFKTNGVQFETYPALNNYTGKVTRFSADQEKIESGEEYVMGVDGGSTTTKACLINIKTNKIAASFYGRTHGDPVKALRECLIEIKKKVVHDTGNPDINISLVAVTGSSREILGVFLETGGVYNEIIAHACGTAHFDKDVDTIFEIGGQDAKYILLKNIVPVDYAMNEACSAGTGSFLEESAEGDLNIDNPQEIGEIALKAENPLKFGEHCSAFINSDIRKAIQQGAKKEDITAGIVTSIVSNYLNRVIGSRTIGRKIFLQGGVAKNKAVPLAFAMLLDREILVPPAPELMGCFGVGLLAMEKNKYALLEKSSFNIEKIINTEIVYERVFECKACENHCPIQVLTINKSKYMFGGRCSKYTNSRKKIEIKTTAIDYVQKRNELMFLECAPKQSDFIRKYDFTVGIPNCLSIYSLYPLFSWFFHELGIKTILSQNIAQEGVARVESAYCFPAEIAHGMVQDVLDRGVDYIFLPHLRDLPSYEQNLHATFCPIIQGLPYYIKKAFPDIPEERFLPLVVSFKYGKVKTTEFFIKLGEKLNIPQNEIIIALNTAYRKQKEYSEKAMELGIEALKHAEESKSPVIALLGRPYNAFTHHANMCIPKKFTSRGYSIIPFDILPFKDEKIFPNMYWYYGQQNIKAAAMLKKEPNIYITYITNFSCAPDSFMLHYVKWLMGTKPFLTLELDSHSADAGIDTRVEAFLDIIDGYKLKIKGIDKERYDNGLSFINNKKNPIHILNRYTNEKIPIVNNKRVKVLLSNMGDLATQITAAITRSAGINSEALPIANEETLQLARAHTSGKECVPAHLVLGSALQYFSSEKYRKDEIYLLFVPITTGPCRTGQYFVYYENLFRDMKLENIVVFTLNADNSYNELGPDFSKRLWTGLVVSDYMKDIQTALRACAKDPALAMMKYKSLWHKIVDSIEFDVKNLIPCLKEAARELSTIPLKRDIKECSKILIVGEIYVRRDDFAIDELIELFSSRNIISKVSGITEWVHYTDFLREYSLKKRLKLNKWYKSIFKHEFLKLLVYKIEKLYKYYVEINIKKALQLSNLIPDAPENMKLIMENTEKYFTSHEFTSEIAVSSGTAATAMEDGFSGIVNISPFACLIGRVIEGLVTPWARERNYPMISVEIDGNQLPPNLVSKLNIFMLNVLRFRNNPDIKELIETAGENEKVEKELINYN